MGSARARDLAAERFQRGEVDLPERRALASSLAAEAGMR
jgi:hypothetical protein